MLKRKKEIVFRGKKKINLLVQYEFRTQGGKVEACIDTPKWCCGRLLSWN
jgi:hypothetical protein